jgi:hypothetical protein
MISTKLISSQSIPVNPLVMIRHAEPGKVADTSSLEPLTCRFYIDRVVQLVDPPEVKGIVVTVFQDLLRLLECLSLIENHLRQIDAAEETLTLFQLIHDEARRFVEFIRTDAINSNVLTEELVDTLDGIAFAVTHDLQRVFDSASRGSAADKSAQVVVGKLYRAYDILTNCLQQSTVTLAMVFDCELIGTKLFNNSGMRYRQSLQLCKDLPELIHLVQVCQEMKGEPTLAMLKDRLEKFRGEGMEYLMYSDWSQFESFCEMIDLSKMQQEELSTVLHQFRCYLETLLGQVRMRNVLADVFPLGIGEEENCQVLTTLAENSASFSESLDPHVDTVWREFAFAV